MFKLTKEQDTAIRKHAAVLLPAIGYGGDGYNPEKRSHQQLHNDRRALMSNAKLLLSAVDDNAPAEETRSFEEANEGAVFLIDAIDEELEKRGERRASRIEEEERRTKRRPLTDTAIFRVSDEFLGEEGYTADDPVTVHALKRGQLFSDYVSERAGGRPKFSEISTGAFLRAMILGPKNEAEKRALSEGTDSAGGYTVPDILSARMIDRLRPLSTVFKAGAQIVPLNSDKNVVAQLLTDPTPAWRTENSSVGLSEPTFGKVELVPKSLAVLVIVSLEVLQDSLNIESALMNALAEALAAEVDRAALFGSGTDPEPKGVINFPGLTVTLPALPTGGTTIDLSSLINMRMALKGVNSDVTAFIMHTNTESIFSRLNDGMGNPLQMPPYIKDIPMLSSSKFPKNLGAGSNRGVLLAGDWSKLMIGFRQTIRIEVLKERYMDKLQYGFLAHLRADVAAEQEKCFTKLLEVPV